MTNEKAIGEFVQAMGCPQARTGKVVSAIRLPEESKLKAAQTRGEVEKILSQEAIVSQIVQASIASRAAYTIHQARGMDGFNPTKKEIPTTRNSEKHRMPANAYTYAQRLLVPDHTDHIYTRLPQPLNELGARQLMLGMPFDPDNFGDEPLSKLIDGLPEMSSLSPQVRRLVCLIHANTVLKALYYSQPSQRLEDDRPTSRFFHTVSTGGTDYIGIYQTLPTRIEHNGRHTQIKKTNLSLYDDQPTAIRSQQHAVEGLEENRLLYTYIRERMVAYLASPMTSVDFRKEMVESLLKQIGKRSGYWFTRIKLKLKKIKEEGCDKEAPNLSRAANVQKDSVSGIHDVLAKKAEISTTAELIQSLGQFSH